MAKDTQNPQDINFQVSGAEKLVGLTAALQDFSGVLQQLLSNPLGGGYVARRIHDTLMSNLVKPMKEFNDLSVKQKRDLEEMAASGRKLATITGVITSLALGMTELVRSTRVASAELGRFYSLDNLPGGAKTLYRGQLELQKNTLEKALQYNEAFSKDYTQTIEELSRKIKADFPNANELQIGDIAKEIALLQKGMGVSFQPFLELREFARSQKIDVGNVENMYKLLMAETFSDTGVLKQLFPEEVAQLFLTNALQFIKKGTKAPLAMKQVTTLMENFQGTAGVQEMSQLLNIVPAIQNERQRNILAQYLLPGLSAEDITTEEAGVNITNALIKAVQGKTKDAEGKGQSFKTIMELFTRNPEVVAKLEAIGVTEGFLQTLNNLKEVKDISTVIADEWDKMNTKSREFGTNTEHIQQTLDAIEESIRNSSNVFEMMINSGKWLINRSQYLISNLTGGKEGKGGYQLPEWQIEAPIVGVLGGVLLRNWLKGRKVQRQILEQLQKMGPEDVKGTTLGPYNPKTGMFERGGVPPPPGKTIPPPKTGMFKGFKNLFKKGGGGRSTLLFLLLPIIDDIVNNLQENTPSFDLSSGEWLDTKEKNKLLAEYKDSPYAMKNLQYGTPGEGIEEFPSLLAHMLFPKQNWQFGNELPMPELGFNELPTGGISSTNPNKIKEIARKQVSYGWGPQVTPPKEEAPKEGEGKDFGTLNVIFSNDKGDILAQTTVDNKMKQTAIRIALSSEIGLG